MQAMQFARALSLGALAVLATGCGEDASKLVTPSQASRARMQIVAVTQRSEAGSTRLDVQLRNTGKAGGYTLELILLEPSVDAIRRSEWPVDAGASRTQTWQLGPAFGQVGAVRVLSGATAAPGEFAPTDCLVIAGDASQCP